VSDSASTLLTRGDDDQPSRPARGGRRLNPFAWLADRVRRIVTFYKQVVAELRKVIWPTRKELLTYTSVVLVFVVIMVAIVGVFDFVFGQGVLQVFGRND
jgi:preprotein translocase subunit SecE